MKLIVYLTMVLMLSMLVCAFDVSKERDIADSYTCYGTSDGYPCSTLNSTCFDYWAYNPASECVMLATYSFGSPFSTSSVAPIPATGVGANATISETYILERNIKSMTVMVRGAGYYGMADGFYHQCKVSFAYYDYSSDSWVNSYSITAFSMNDYNINVPVSAIKSESNQSILTYLARIDCGLWAYSRGIKINYVYDTKSDACQNGICCNYDEAPYMTKTIDWSCSTHQDAQCLVGLFWNESLLSVSPSAEDVPNYGRVSIMSAKSGLLNFRVEAKDLYPSEVYTVKVFCHSNSSASEYVGYIVPQYGLGKELPVLTVNLKKNMPYIIGGIIGLIFLGLAIWALKIAWG